MPKGRPKKSKRRDTAHKHGYFNEKTQKASINYPISRNFSKDPILALLAKLFSSLKLSIANNTPSLDIMCFSINLSKITKIISRQNLILNFLLQTLNFILAINISACTVSWRFKYMYQFPLIRLIYESKVLAKPNHTHPSPT